MSKEEVEIKKESKKDKKEKKEKKETKKETKKEKKEKKDKKVSEDEENDGSDSDDSEELAIDLNAGVPLSKKQKRLLKKGKLNLEKLARKNPPPKPILTEEQQLEESAKEPKKSEHGVWIGNLSFDTTKEDLMRFITGKTNAYGDDDSDFIKVEQEDLVRINIPKKENKIKGFAYVDFPSAKHVETVVSLSESQLNGRNLLIKNANSFEGRPKQDSNPISKNPPSRILFVGNLSFDTTKDLLEEHFRHCGEIVKIRMATFEDTGKCKGFAFIDFRDESGPTTALKSKLARSLINRPLRLEYGEDRSKLTPKKFSRKVDSFESPEQSIAPQPQQATVPRERVKPPISSFKRKFDKPENASNKRPKSSIALATAQRASVAIVPSSGKKTTFD